MEAPQMPWEWKDDWKVVLQLDSGPKEFTLLPVDRNRVARFRQALTVARKICETFAKAQKAFETGQAEYTNAARRLKKLLEEFGKASNEQLEIAQEVGVFFEPKGLAQEFGHAVDILTEFAAQTIEKVRDREIKAAAAKAADEAKAEPSNTKEGAPANAE